MRGSKIAVFAPKLALSNFFTEAGIAFSNTWYARASLNET